MSCNYSLLKDIFIPLVSACIGGGLTLLGVLLTLRYESKKGEIEYRERIRPFLVVESLFTADIDVDKIKQIAVSDDSDGDLSDDDILFQIDDLLLTNVSDYVCIIEYIKIGEISYKPLNTVKLAIKPNESVAIVGYPASWYYRKEMPQVVIGLLDRRFNRYEYSLAFSIANAKKDHRMEEILGSRAFKTVCFESIDCSKNLYTDDKRDKHND